MQRHTGPCDSLENEAEPSRRVAEFFVETLLPGLPAAACQVQCSKAAQRHWPVWSFLSALDGAELQEVPWRWLAAMAYCSNPGLQTAGCLQGSAKGAEQDPRCQAEACREESYGGSEAAEGCRTAEEEARIRSKPCRQGGRIPPDGCLSCSRWKATRYWLQREGFGAEHLYGASGAVLYQKSKQQA